ncbi:MAG: helix-turn-helix domain-containing protein [Actinomycetota bacterium]|nr:helix-turn-helix domain-containing protein [Actinomycetota bacterium]
MYVDVAGRIFDLRHERGWSQSELARRSGVHNVTISRLEGEIEAPRLVTLRKLAKAFDVPVGELKEPKG